MHSKSFMVILYCAVMCASGHLPNPSSTRMPGSPVGVDATASGCQRGRWAESEHPQEVRTRPSEPWALRYRFSVDSVANVIKKKERL